MDEKLSSKMGSARRSAAGHRARPMNQIVLSLLLIHQFASRDDFHSPELGGPDAAAAVVGRSVGRSVGRFFSTLRIHIQRSFFLLCPSRCSLIIIVS